MTETVKNPRKVIDGSGWANPLTHDVLLESTSHLTVWADDVELTLGVDYTLTNASGGTPATNDPDGYRVVVSSPGSWDPDVWVLEVAYPVTQGYGFTPSFGAQYEGALDALARRVQMLQDGVNRAAKLDRTQPDDVFGPSLPAAAEGKALVWDAAGDLINGPGADDIAVAQGYAAEAKEYRDTASTHATSAANSADAAANAAAEAAEAAEAVAAGGATGQVLTKASGVDYDTTWTTVATPDIVYADDYGAVGDGVTDDTDALEAGLNAAAAANGTFRLRTGKTYLVTDHIGVDRTGKTHLEFDLAGSTLLLNGATANIAFYVSAYPNPTPFLVTSMAANVAKNASNFQLTSVVGVQAGDLVEIRSPALSGLSMGSNHVYVVTSVSGSNVYIQGVVVADITAAQMIADGTGSAITDAVVNVYRPATGLTIKNGFVRTDDTTEHDALIIVRGHDGTVTDNVSFYGHCRNQLMHSYAGTVTTNNCRFEKFGYTSEDNYYVSEGWAPSGLSFGYGLYHALCYHAVVTNCHATRGWHGFEISNGAVRVDFVNCTATRCAYGFNAHAGPWHVNWYNCRTSGCIGYGSSPIIYPTWIGCISDGIAGNSSLQLSKYNRIVTIKNCWFGTAFAAASAAGAIRTDATAYTLCNGSISAGFNDVWELSATTLHGYQTSSFGMNDIHRVVVSGCQFVEGALLGVGAKTWMIANNNYWSASGGSSPHQMTILFAATTNILVAGNVVSEVSTTAGTGAAFALITTGVNPASARFLNNVVPGTLVRIYDGSTTMQITEMKGNSCGTWLAVGAGANCTITDAWDNTVNTTALTSSTLIGNSGNNRRRSTGTFWATASDADFTLTPINSAENYQHYGTITAVRTVTLSTTGAQKGMKFKLTRTSAGAFDLSFGGLKNLATNTWAEATYNGSAWVLTAYGAL